MKTVMQLALSVIVAVGAYLGWLYVTQERLVYFPDADVRGTPADVGLRFERVWLTTSDGVRLLAWYIPHASPRGVVLFCHGNAGNISHRLDTVRVLASMGLSVLLFDYRGYGESEGEPTEEGTYKDAQAAWEYLTIAREIPAREVIVWGRSLGGGVASWLAAEHTPRALILESTFTSIPDLGVRVYRWLPVRLLARIHYATERRLAAISCPVLVIHSPQDEVVPYDLGRRLYDAARPPRRFLEIEGPHNDGFLRSLRKYTDGVEAFLRDEARTREGFDEAERLAR